MHTLSTYSQHLAAIRFRFVLGMSYRVTDLYCISSLSPGVCPESVGLRRVYLGFGPVLSRIWWFVLDVAFVGTPLLPAAAPHVSPRCPCPSRVATVGPASDRNLRVFYRFRRFARVSAPRTRMTRCRPTLRRPSLPRTEPRRLRPGQLRRVPANSGSREVVVLALGLCDRGDCVSERKSLWRTL